MTDTLDGNKTVTNLRTDFPRKWALGVQTDQIKQIPLCIPEVKKIKKSDSNSVA